MWHALEGFSSLTTASPEKEKHLMSQFSLIVSSPIGVVAALALAAYLEVQGDACFPIVLSRVLFCVSSSCRGDPAAHRQQS